MLTTFPQCFVRYSLTHPIGFSVLTVISGGKNLNLNQYEALTVLYFTRRYMYHIDDNPTYHMDWKSIIVWDCVLLKKKENNSVMNQALEPHDDKVLCVWQGWGLLRATLLRIP